MAKTAVEVDQPLPGDPLGATVHRLDNGLTVYVSTDHALPRISAWITVRAGSRYDPPESTGLAHYLEHMLFKGSARLGALNAAAEEPHLTRIAALYDQLYAEKDDTARASILKRIDAETQATAPFVAPNELDRLYSGLGFRKENAFTSDDATTYVVDLPAGRLEPWAKIASEELEHATFRLFYPELEAVYEEKNSTLDSPEERFAEAMRALLYPLHPYGTQTTIGRPEHLKNPAFKDMVAFFHRWYVPSNVAIVLAGDVDVATALPIVRKYFGDWQGKPAPSPPPAIVAPLHGRRIAEIRADGVEQVELGWQAVPADHEDAVVFEVLDSLLDNPSGGLLNTELVLPQKVPSASSAIESLREAGAFMVGAAARDGQPLEEVERLLRQTVDQVKRGDFSDEDLAAIRLANDIEDKRALETNDDRVNVMASAFVDGRPWPDEVARRERLRRVTKADLVRVANRYLGDDVAVVYRRRGSFEAPKIPKPHITPLPDDTARKSAFARELEAMPAVEVKPQILTPGHDYDEARLPAGKLIAVPNRRNDLFSLTYLFETGLRRQPLLCHALALHETTGAADMTAAALQKQLFRLGAAVSLDCQADQVVLEIEGVDGKMVETLALVDRWFRQPRIDAADLGKLVQTELTDRRNSVEDPRLATDALENYTMQGKDSSTLLEPSNAELARASLADVRPLITGFLDHEHETLYFGPRSTAAAAAVIGLGRQHQPLPARPPLRLVKRATDQILFLGRPMAQAQIGMLFPIGPVPRDRWGTLKLLLQYLGDGPASLVYHDIRERRGLAYMATVGPMLGPRPGDDSALVGLMATQPDKADEAVARLLALLRQVPLDQTRFRESKIAAIEEMRSHRHTPREIPEYVHHFEDLGETSDPRPRHLQQLAALEPRVFEKELHAMTRQPVAIALTGDRARLQLGALATKAAIKTDKNTKLAIEELGIDQLFSYGPFPPLPAGDGSRPTPAAAVIRRPAANPVH